MIIDKIKDKCLDLLNEINENFKVIDFSFSLPYSYVLIKNTENGKKALGVAMTLLEEYRGHKHKNTQIIKDLDKFINMSNSLDIVKRTLGIAAINALSQYYIDFDPNGEDATQLVIKRNDIKKVAFVGNMVPIVNAIKNTEKFNVYVFERNPSLISDNILSDGFEYRLLPKMDAVFISGTTLINDTLDFIIDRCKNAKLKILVGPTVQSLPWFFKRSGITHIASTKIQDIENALLHLKFASSSILFKKYSKKYTISVD